MVQCRGDEANEGRVLLADRDIDLRICHNTVEGGDQDSDI